MWEGCAKQGAEEGPRRFGRGPQEGLSGRDTRGGCGSFAELAEAVGRNLSQDRGTLGTKVYAFFVFFTPHPKAPLAHWSG